MPDPAPSEGKEASKAETDEKQLKEKSDTNADSTKESEKNSEESKEVETKEKEVESNTASSEKDEKDSGEKSEVEEKKKDENTANEEKEESESVSEQKKDKGEADDATKENKEESNDAEEKQNKESEKTIKEDNDSEVPVKNKEEADNADNNGKKEAGEKADAAEESSEAKAEEAKETDASKSETENTGGTDKVESDENKDKKETLPSDTEKKDNEVAGEVKEDKEDTSNKPETDKSDENKTLANEEKKSSEESNPQEEKKEGDDANVSAKREEGKTDSGTEKVSSEEKTEGAEKLDVQDGKENKEEDGSKPDPLDDKKPDDQEGTKEKSSGEEEKVDVGKASGSENESSDKANASEAEKPEVLPENPSSTSDEATKPETKTDDSTNEQKTGDNPEVKDSKLEDSNDSPSTSVTKDTNETAAATGGPPPVTDKNADSKPTNAATDSTNASGALATGAPPPVTSATAVETKAGDVDSSRPAAVGLSDTAADSTTGSTSVDAVVTKADPTNEDATKKRKVEVVPEGASTEATAATASASDGTVKMDISDPEKSALKRKPSSSNLDESPMKKPATATGADSLSQTDKDLKRQSSGIEELKLSPKKSSLLRKAKLRGSLSRESIFALSLEWGMYRDLIAVAMTCKAMNKAMRYTRLWKIMVFGLVKTLDAHIAPVNVLTSHSQWVFSGSSDGKVKAWDTKTWQCKKTLNITPLPRQNRGPHVAPSRGPIAPAHPPTSSSSRTNARGRGRNSPSRPSATTPAIPNPAYQTGEQVIPVTALAIYEKSLLVGLDDGQLIAKVLFNDKGSSLTAHAHNGAVKVIAVGRSKIFTGGADGIVSVWNPRTLQLEKQFRRHANVVSALRVCSNYLFSGSHDTNIFVWNLNSLEYKTVLHDKSLDDQIVEDPKKRDPRKKPNKSHSDRITDIKSHANILYTASWDCYIKQWDAKKHHLLRSVFLLPVGICWSMSIRSIKGYPESYLICGTGDGDIEVRSLKNLRKLTSMMKDGWTNRREVHKGWVKCLLPLQDGRIISASEDWSVKIWDHRGAKPPVVPAYKKAVYTKSASIPKGMTAAQHQQMMASSHGPKSNGPQYQRYVANGQAAARR